MYERKLTRPLLSTCMVCRRVPVNSDVILISDAQAAADRCGLCRLLTLGIQQLKQHMPEVMRAAFGQCTHLHFNPQNKGDDSFAFLMVTGPEWIELPTVTHPQFEVFLAPSAETIKFLGPSALRHDVPQSLDVERVVLTIRKWMASCDKYHPRCNLSVNAVLPKRVLSISSRTEGPIKLEELSGVQAPYIALSYAWGPSGMNIRTTSVTLADHFRGISWSRLPRLFQDVVSICRALSIRYLWIDALCIIQDSVEDWELQSAQMASIYSNSYLTIAASSCADPQGTLFSDRWTYTILPEQVDTKIGVQSVAIESEGFTFLMRPLLNRAHVRFSELDNAQDHLADAPLLARAWAYQERLLPSRTLHFHAEELVWECKTSARCECGSMDDIELKEAEYYNLNKLASINSRRWLKSFVAQVEVPGKISAELCSIWMDLVSEYSALSLTYERDRLPALSGLAAKFTNTVLGRYFAGMWTKTLPAALLWEVLPGDRPGFSQASGNLPSAPSWSWASVPMSRQTRISYSRVIEHMREVSPIFEVLNINAKVIGKNPFGWVKNAILSVRAHTITCTALKNDHGATALDLYDAEMQFKYPSPQALLMDFCMDYPGDYESQMSVLVLYAGSNFGLALQKIAEDHGNFPTYRRIGLAHWTNNDTVSYFWKSCLRVKEISIV